MQRELVIPFLSVLLLFLLCFATGLPRYAIFLIWITILVLCYTGCAAVDRSKAKSIKGIQWKEGMVLTTMFQHVEPHFLTEFPVTLFRLNGQQYFHTLLVVSEPPDPSVKKSRQPPKLHVMEINTVLTSKKSSIQHRKGKLGIIAQTTPIDEYLKYLDTKGAITLRLYHPPEKLSSVLLHQSLIEEIQNEPGIHSSVGFIYHYLLRTGSILSYQGTSMIPKMFRYTPSQLDKQLIQSGWTRKLYKK